MAVRVVCFFLTMLWVGLQCVIVAFPVHTHLLFGIKKYLLYSETYLFVKQKVKKHIGYFIRDIQYLSGNKT